MISCFIHIGYPKTATTSLQKNLFMKHSDIFYHGNPIPEARTLLAKIAHSDEYELEEEKIRAEIEDLHKKAKGKVLILSEESISASSHPSLAAQRLKKFFPDAKIIMSIRNQKTLIESQYENARKLWFAPKPYSKKPVSFENYFEYNLKNLKKRSSGRYDKSFNGNVFEFINYNRQYTIYEKIFGADNIHVIMYEELKKNPEQFISDISNIIGINIQKASELLFSAPPQNQSLKGLGRILKRIKNLILPNKALSDISPALGRFAEKIRTKLKRKKQSMSAAQCAQINEIFKDSNLEFMRKTNLDLRAYNYPGTDDLAGV